MAILCKRCHERVFSQHYVDDNQCDLFSELEQMDALMDQLRLRRLDLKRKINHRCSPIIRQLPHDVLSIVFSFCLPDYTTFHTSLSKFDLSAPLILGAVCKDWRETVWSSPMLWSAMAINISPSNAIFKSQMSLARMWLARSGLLPLSIRIVTNRDPTLKRDWEDFPLAKLALALFSVASRWHSFHLRAPPQIYHIFCGSNLSTPILESLRFETNGFPPPEPFSSTKHRKFRLLHCPRLQEIHIRSVSARWIRVPMDGITRIYADHLPVNELLWFLQKCPLSAGLKHLTINLVLIESRLIDHYLRGIAAPCLETITLFGIDVDNLPFHLIRSTRSLRAISLENTRFSLDGMMSLLGTIPTLEHLRVSAQEKPRETYIMLQVLARVIASQGQPNRGDFLPNLETFTFMGRSIPSKIPHISLTGPWSPDYVPQRPLCSVTIIFSFPSTEVLVMEALPFLLCLKQYGIMLKVFEESYMTDILQPSIDLYESSFGEVDDVDLDSSLFELEAVQ